MSRAVSMTSRGEGEVYQFSWPVTIGVPLLALFVQVFVSKWLGFIRIFDFPLLVTIFFAVARRRPIPGLMTGAVIGTLQDIFAGTYIGLNGIAKTMVGFLASSLGVRIDVDVPGSRFLMTVAFSLIHRLLYVVIDRGLVAVNEPWNWKYTLVSAVLNGLMSVILFAGLDRLKQRP